MIDYRWMYMSGYLITHLPVNHIFPVFNMQKNIY